jgi:4-amino-4-deoxy-L-arabinose transferase-like glycosyltransferase
VPTTSEKPTGNSLRWIVPCFGVLFITLALKVSLLVADAFPLNADEAVVGLMGRHILQGRWPIFFYGQAYMGSLDAVLVAGAFRLAGISAVAIRAVQCLLFLGTVWMTMILAKRYLLSQHAAIVAGLLMAIPTVNVTLYSTVSLGGYGESLFLGNLLLLLTLNIKDMPARRWTYFIWGLIAGLGFWAFGLTLVYSLPAGILLGVVIWRRKTRRWLSVLFVLLGLMIGAAPWIVHAASQGLGPLLSELVGSAIAVESGAGAAGGILSRLLSLLVLGSTVILGLRPPWEVQWLAWPLAPIVLAFWLAVLLHTVMALRRRDEGRALRWLLAWIVSFLFLGFLLTPFGGDPSGRYFLPLAVPMALMAADFIDRIRLQINSVLIYGLLGIVLAFNLWGTLQANMASPTGLTTQFDPITRIDHQHDAELIDFLEQHEERYGYSNYWVSYPIAFQSNEQIIFIPRLPYHPDFRYTERDDRYPPYTELVDGVSRVAYITTHHPDLDEYLRDAFQDLGVEFDEIRIGDYQVFYGLSKLISPQDIGLGSNTP